MLHWLIFNLIDCGMFMYEVIWVFVSYFKVIIPFTHSAPANAIDCAHTNERERYWYFGDSADRKNIPSVDGKRIVEEVFCYSNKITLPPSTILCIRIEIKSKTNSKKKNTLLSCHFCHSLSSIWATRTHYNVAVSTRATHIHSERNSSKWHTYLRIYAHSMCRSWCLKELRVLVSE